MKGDAVRCRRAYIDSWRWAAQDRNPCPQNTWCMARCRMPTNKRQSMMRKRRLRRAGHGLIIATACHPLEKNEKLKSSLKVSTFKFVLHDASCHPFEYRTSGLTPIFTDAINFLIQLPEGYTAELFVINRGIIYCMSILDTRQKWGPTDLTKRKLRFRHVTNVAGRKLRGWKSPSPQKEGWWILFRTHWVLAVQTI